jgi:hypothetical protein
MSRVLSERTPEPSEADLEQRVAALEEQVSRLSALVEPEADFDTGIFSVPPRSAMVVEHGFGKRAGQLDAVLILPDGSEDPLPVVVPGGKVFATPPEMKGCRVHNTGSLLQHVRVRAYRG